MRIAIDVKSLALKFIISECFSLARIKEKTSLKIFQTLINKSSSDTKHFSEVLCCVCRAFLVALFIDVESIEALRLLDISDPPTNMTATARSWLFKFERWEHLWMKSSAAVWIGRIYRELIRQTEPLEALNKRWIINFRTKWRQPTLKAPRFYTKVPFREINFNFARVV